jgi:hypothetical protein
MRASMSFFAGAGTVIAALALGLGGGLVISNVMSPHDASLSKVERRADRQAQPSQAPQPEPSTVGSNTKPSSYLAQVQPAANAPMTVAPAPSNSPLPQAEASAPPPQINEKSAANDAVAKPLDNKPVENKPAPAKPVEAKAADAKPAEAAAPAPQPSPAQQASREQDSSPDNAYAKARDADVKQQRKAERADRRQQWAARRAQQRDQEMRDVERRVREDSDGRGAREVIVRRDNIVRDDDDDRDDRQDFGRPARFDFPRMMFGRD